MLSQKYPVRGIRGKVKTRNTAALVHTTLCRYGDRLTDLAKLLTAATEARLDMSTEVTELVVSQERVCPSLETVGLARLPLDGP